MIVKEYRCTEHGDFERGLGICPQCGKVATRVFLTAPGLGFGVSKRIDSVIEGEFARRGISNYTNAGGAPRVNYGSGEYNGIRAGWGKEYLSNVQREYQHMMAPGTQLAPPNLPPGSNDPALAPQKNSVPWARAVPSEVMDLHPK